jgi:FG-GAP repeat
MMPVVAAVLAATLAAAAFPAGASARVGARPAAALALQVGVFADFNGDGPTDLAVGAPMEDFGSTGDAGAVSVFLGTATGTGLSGVGQTLVQDNPEAGDRFGAALAVGDFNGDPFDDLVVGAPREDVGATVDAGAVNVLFGSPAGLTTGQTLLQDNPETGDQFGAALTVGFIDVGEIDLVVGAPGEDVGATVDAGVANLFSNTTGVLPSVSGPALLQDNPEAGDRFGAALTAGRFDVDGFDDLVVGAPGENVGASVGAGAANLFSNPAGVLPGVSGPALLQDNPEAGDQFGTALAHAFFTSDGFDDLVVGGPGEDVGATTDAGAVNFFANTASGLPGVSGPALLQDNPEAGDQFGTALVAAGLGGGSETDLAVGAPGENVGSTVDAGAANLLINANGVLPSVSGPALLQDNPEAGDRFGAALTAKVLGGDGFFDLVVGAPGENVGATVDAGAANVISNSGGVLPTVSGQTLLQGGVETGDQFGAALDV